MNGSRGVDGHEDTNCACMRREPTVGGSASPPSISRRRSIESGGSVLCHARSTRDGHVSDRPGALTPPRRDDAHCPCPAATMSGATMDDIPEELRTAPVDEIKTRTRLLETEVRVLKSEHMRLLHDQNVMKERIKDNADKIAQNKVLPYLVGNVVEVCRRFCLS